MKLDELYKNILQELDEDPNREGLQRTPQRVAQAMQFLTQGYHQNLETIVNSALFESSSSDLIIVKDIEIYSLCEHHMLPFFGRCHIGYIPKDKVIGVSKLARIADMFSRRLQIQERLTHQISNALMETLEPEGVGVVIEAQHLCMMMRGVEKQTSKMVTSAMNGSFRHYTSTRNEFLKLIGDSSFR